MSRSSNEPNTPSPYTSDDSLSHDVSFTDDSFEEGHHFSRPKNNQNFKVGGKKYSSNSNKNGDNLEKASHGFTLESKTEKRYQKEPIQNASGDYKKTVTNNHTFSTHDSFTEESSPKLDKNTSSLSSFPVAAIILTCIGGVLVALFANWCTKELTLNDSPKTCEAMSEYDELYPMQYTDFWTQIQVGIEHVQTDTPPAPAVFLLVYSDKQTVTKTLNRITEIVKLCLDSRGGALKLSSDELQREEVVKNYGILIKKYKKILEERRVMIVKDVQNVPPLVSPVFHAFCDTTSPVVKKSALFFTMEMTDDEISLEYNDLLEVVENRLSALWKSGVDKDKLQPLITRLTDNVLPVQPIMP